MTLVRTLTFFIALAYIHTVRPVCFPVEEGQPTNISCEYTTTHCGEDGFRVLWYADVNYVALCVDSEPCNSTKPYITATRTSSGSTLSISQASRAVHENPHTLDSPGTEPVNMETSFTCGPCGEHFPVCAKLQIYAMPKDAACSAREVTESGDITAVTVSCSTTKIYPKAKCSFYHMKNTSRVDVTTAISYDFTELGGAVPYYRSSCSVRLPVSELGEGTHSFQGYIFPDVTGGEYLVSGITPDLSVTLTLPEVSHSCSSYTIEGFYEELTVDCTCRLTSAGYPAGQAIWVSEGVDLVQNSINITYDRGNPERVFTCEGVSAIGRKVGSTLPVKFILKARTVQKQLNKMGSVIVPVIIAVLLVVAVAIIAYNVKCRAGPHGGGGPDAQSPGPNLQNSLPNLIQPQSSLQLTNPSTPNPQVQFTKP